MTKQFKRAKAPVRQSPARIARDAAKRKAEELAQASAVVEGFKFRKEHGIRTVEEAKEQAKRMGQRVGKTGSPVAFAELMGALFGIGRR